jgi:hypothetical protein
MWLPLPAPLGSFYQDTGLLQRAELVGNHP